MKVLWLNGRPVKNPGGTEQHTVDFANSLKKVKDIELFLAVAKDSFVNSKLEDFNNKIYVKFKAEFAPRNSYKLIKESLRIKPDVIIANNGNEYVNAFVAGKLSKARIFLFRHMVANQPFTIKKFIFPNVDKILAVSDYVKEFLINEEKVDPDKIDVIYNFIDPEEFKYSDEKKKEIRKELNFSEEDMIMLFCGKVEIGKGINEFIEVFRILKNKHKNLKAILVGGGKKLKEIKKIFEGNKDILILGPQKKVAKFYIASDIFLMPTYANESFGRTIIEAFATKTSVVATDLGNIPYLIKDGVNGFLTKVRDINDMIKKVNILIENKQLRNKFQEESYQIYNKKFHKDVVFNKFLNLIKS
ncbi:glycosyltransferase family 4 protein [Hydrogenothermus marinus]|uniref:Glycosyltransferase involved in cell wall biosynthesis n=1 Tax=Hydrogenothermus marinus TaxID=133270 RepID=A0A3M0B9B3_9AQUI|nr:glycosyltransferase family 4 protein [Hydrogenothermus marinus]RMA93074.1 glycosyltransferase involved in cell wall biosynthesis [Hydrogenothermus marinus]